MNSAYKHNHTEPDPASSIPYHITLCFMLNTIWPHLFAFV